QEAERGQRPQEADRDHGDAQRKAAQQRWSPGSDAGDLFGLDGCGGGGHSFLFRAREVRRVVYITGSPPRKSSLASAAPRPSLKNWKISWNIRTATTSSLNRPPVVT